MEKEQYDELIDKIVSYLPPLTQTENDIDLQLLDVIEECVKIYNSNKLKVDISHKSPYNVPKIIKDLITNFVNEFDINTVGDIYDLIHSDVLSKYLKQQHNILYNRAKDELFKKLDKHNYKYTLSRVKLLQSFKTNNYLKPLTNDEIEQINESYCEAFDAKHNIVRYHDDKFKDNLVKYVVEHPDELLMNKDEFNSFVSNWPRTSKMLNDWYDVYVDLFYKQLNKSYQYKPTTISIIYGFKSKSKVKALKQLLPNRVEALTKEHFPLKQNKSYQLHKVSVRGSYLIDLMFEVKFIYLIVININTRYLFVEPLNVDLSDENVVKYAKAQKIQHHIYEHCQR